MNRSALTVTTWLLLVAILLVACPAASAQTPPLDAATIKAGLRTTIVEEQGFVDMVVGRVKAGLLPASVVKSTFQYARRKKRHRFQYFRRATIILAAAIGKPLPV